MIKDLTWAELLVLNLEQLQKLEILANLKAVIPGNITQLLHEMLHRD